jgi:hypothetical protein
MNLELTDRNHIQFVSSTETWSARYGRCRRPVQSFRQECLMTARLIASKTHQPIWVLFSGGLDSEVVAQSFELAAVPFHIAIMRFSQDLNQHDIEWAVKACQKNKWPFTFFDLDIHQFWEKNLLQYSIPSKCISPQLAATMWLMDQVEGYPVLGSGECLLTRPDSHCYDWSLVEKEKVASWYRFLEYRKKNGCAGFFQYTPEIMLSALDDPFLKNWTRDPSHRQLSNAAIKYDLYSQHFELEKREKYTGFEKLAQSDSYYRAILKELMPNYDRVYKTEYFELIRKLSFSRWRTFLKFS